VDYTGQPQADSRVTVVLERVTYKSGDREPAVEQLAQSDVTTGADGHAAWQASSLPTPVLSHPRDDLRWTDARSRTTRRCG